MFWLSINISPTADTTLSLGVPRALAGATAWSHQVMSPVNAMGTHAPLPMTMTTVTNTADAITFLHGLEEACNTRGFGWWYKSAVGTTDEQTAAQRELDKATRLDQLMDQELQSAIASQHGVRLNMDDADTTPQATIAPLRRRHASTPVCCRTVHTASRPSRTGCRSSSPTPLGTEPPSSNKP